MKKLLCILAITGTASGASAEPPYRGTIFVDPDIITPDDPTSFKQLAKSGQGRRRMFDRRSNQWVHLKVHLFIATFDEKEMRVEVQVNPEFDSETAFKEAKKYLQVIGQLPVSLRKHVKTVWIHKGDKDFGGGKNHLLIHTSRGERYRSQGILAETFVHEATHTSLDAFHASSERWIDAQKKDQGFISRYAKENPNREDLAESFLLYLALHYKPDRIDDETKRTILKTMPNRIAYFDRVNFRMHPIDKTERKPATNEK